MTVKVPVVLPSILINPWEAEQGHIASPICLPEESVLFFTDVLHCSRQLPTWYVAQVIAGSCSMPTKRLLLACGDKMWRAVTYSILSM